MTNTFKLYLSRQASGLGRYVLEQAVTGLFGWVPSVVGIGLRAVAYRLIMRIDGVAAIENGVRIRFADQIRLARGVYVDLGVYLHACPGGIEIGSRTIVMRARARCRAAGSSGLRSAAPFFTSRGLCSSTSPHRGWIRSAGASSGS